MSNLLRDIFSDAYTDRYQKLAEELHAKAMEERKSVRLAPDREIPGLYVRVDKECAPGFAGDCCYCSTHTPEVGIVDGFWCLRHGWACGYGYTCPDNDYEGNVGWPEFERIKRAAT